MAQIESVAWRNPTASSSGLTRGSIQKVEKLELSRLGTNDRREEKRREEEDGSPDQVGEWQGLGGGEWQGLGNEDIYGTSCSTMA